MCDDTEVPMHIANTPEEAIAVAENLYSNIPHIDFSAVLDPINMSFPKRQTAESSRETYINRGELSGFIRLATEKLYFRDFLRNDDLLSWPNENLVREKDYIDVVQQAPKNIFPVNSTVTEAIEWFENDVIKLVGDSVAGRPETRFLVGNPGAGKSTLIKYLLNKTRYDRREKSLVIASRFEASKYIEWINNQMILRDIKLPNPREFEKLNAALLKQYCDILLLRDLLFDYGFDVDNNGYVKPSRRVFTRDTQVGDLLDRIIPVYVRDDEQGLIKSLIIDHLFPDKRVLDADLIAEVSTGKYLFNLKSPIVSSLLRGFSDLIQRHNSSINKTVKFCVVFDGLDFLGVEETEIDHPKHILLNHILAGVGFLSPEDAQRTSLTKLVGNVATFPYSALILMRPTTFVARVALFNPVTQPRAVLEDRVASPALDVVVFRAVARALNRLGYNPAEVSAKQIALFRIVTILLDRHNASWGGHQTSGSANVFSLFDGNLRDGLDLIGRLVKLYAQEVSTKPIKLDDLLAFAETTASDRLAERRAYRSSEVLLYDKTGHFTNAVILNSDGSLERNDRHEGKIDNIFNYHYTEALGNQGHYLLIKLRLLQAWGAHDLFLEEYQLEAHLEALGYNVTERRAAFRTALQILEHTGMLEIEASDGAKMFRRTARGAFVVEHLIIDPDYLEHVFHQTLFPEMLVGGVVDRAREARRAEDWAISAMRNYYILLTYASFVEQIDARQGWRRVPDELLIVEKMKKKIIEAVRGIIKGPNGVNLFTQAYHEIMLRYGHWVACRLIHEELPKS